MSEIGSGATATRRPGRRLAVKYAGAVFLVSGSVMLAQGFVTTWLTWREDRRLVAEIQVQRVAAAAAEIRHFMRDIESRLGGLVATPWLNRDEAERRIDGLRLMRVTPSIAELAYVDPTGREVFALSRTGLDRTGGLDRSSDPEVAAARVAGTHRGNVTFRDGSEPRVRIAVTGTGSKSGVAIGEIDLKLVWDTVSRIEIGHSGRAWVADDQGRLIAHPDIDLVLKQTSVAHLAPVAEVSAHVDADPMAFVDPVVDLAGERVLAARARIPELGWVVVAELPTREAYAPVIAGLWLAAAILAGGLLAAVGASLLLARGMTMPIRQLRAGAERIGAGELDHRIAVTSDDELGDLGARFNDMAARLQASYATLERRVAERTAELTLANAAKSHFFAAANHDLRQPLHALNLFVAQLAHETDAERRRRTMERLEAALAAMNELFDALLDVAKLDAGAIEPSVATVAIPRLFERLEATFAPAAEAKGIALRIEATDVTVRSDPLLLERILQNLLANAIRYTETGSVRLACEPAGNQLAVVVADTGIGIAPDQQRLVFTEFYRAGGERRLGGGGLGLGLSIVDRLANLLGHQIELVSHLGEGTTFRVLSAAAETQVSEGTSPPTLRAPPATAVAFGDGLRALAVDDDPLALDAVVALLEDWGFDVTAAASAGEAVASGAGTCFDLIVCDRRLGAEDGLTLIRDFAAAGLTRVTILVSGDTGEDLAAAARAAGVPLLAKPVSPMILRALIMARLAETAA